MLIKLIDGISEFSGRLCAWSLFVVGFFITFEVVMRYVFNAPTIWVDEICRVIQVWVVYLAAAYVLKHNDMVTVEVFLSDPKTIWRKLAETFAILVLFLFAGTALFYGYQIWLKATLAAHTTDTFLAPPKMITHASVWVGSLLLILQGGVKLYRIWTGELAEDDVLGGEV
ncbi:MAG: TRAP transporter small permease [Pseudomonadota bacterium]